MTAKIDSPSVGPQPLNVTPEEFNDQIKRIKSSQKFSTSNQLQCLLNLLARHLISARVTALTQQEIAAELGLRDFDPTKPTIRIAAGRLRTFLRDYYETEGKSDPILIGFEKGGPYRLSVHRRAVQPFIRSDEAFSKYTEGRLLWAQRTPETLRQAVECFQAALHHDPNYADSHAALAECYLFMAVWGMAPRKVMPFGRRHAQQAVRLNPFSAEAHATLGGILSAYDWNWGKAWNAFDRAFKLDSRCVTALCLRATHFLSVGNPKGASEDAHLTLKLTSASPSPLVNTHVAKILYAARLYDEAEDLLRRVIEMIPTFYLAHWQLGLILVSKGKCSRGLTFLDKARQLAPDGPSVVGGLGWAKAIAGQIEGAKSIIQQLLQERKKRYIPATDLAMIYGALGEMEPAFRWLRRACRERALFLSWLAVWPPFERLYLDPHSAVILDKTGLSKPNLRRR